LIASVFQNRGIPAVSISLLREVTEKVKPPRSLFVPFPLGYPLGRENDPEIQKSIIREALSMLKENPETPLVRDYQT